MRIRRTRAWVLAALAIVSCGKSSSSPSSPDGSTDAGTQGPTDLVISWTLAGKPADVAGCTQHGAPQIFLNLSGTLDPSLHQSSMLACATASTTFPQLLVEELGSPYLEGTLLDDQGKTVAITGLPIVPTVGTTRVSINFFSPQNTGGAGGAMGSSSSSSSSTSASSGAEGDGGTSSSSTSSSSTSASSSSTSASSSGAADAGPG